MPTSVSWSVNVSVCGGPQLTESRAGEVEAFDVIKITVPAGEVGAPGEATVEVQPAAAAEDVLLVLIKSDRYSQAPDEELLKFSVEGGQQDIALDAPQWLVGRGAIGLLGASPKKLEFQNELGAGNDAAITIIVGRNATP